MHTIEYHLERRILYWTTLQPSSPSRSSFASVNGPESLPEEKEEKKRGKAVFGGTATCAGVAVRANGDFLKLRQAQVAAEGQAGGGETRRRRTQSRRYGGSSGLAEAIEKPCLCP